MGTGGVIGGLPSEESETEPVNREAVSLTPHSLSKLEVLSHSGRGVGFALSYSCCASLVCPMVGVAMGVMTTWGPPICALLSCFSHSRVCS